MVDAEDISQAEQCQRAINAALDVAFENHCTTADSRKQQFSEVMGVEPDVDCEAALAEGLDQQTCSDFRGVRQWIMCKAIRLVSEEGVRFSTAMSRAWNEAKSECKAQGVDV